MYSNIALRVTENTNFCPENSYLNFQNFCPVYPVLMNLGWKLASKINQLRSINLNLSWEMQSSRPENIRVWDSIPSDDTQKNRLFWQDLS